MTLIDKPAVFNGYFWDCPFKSTLEDQISKCKQSMQSIKRQCCAYLRDDDTCRNIYAHKPIQNKDDKK